MKTFKRFQREALSASSLHHKNIVDITMSEKIVIITLLWNILKENIEKLIKERGALTVTKLLTLCNS